MQDQNPADQARFWLDAVPKVDSVADDPQIAMGAAWMLDSPQLGWISKHVRLKQDPFLQSLPKEFRRELDQDAIIALVQDFESQCRDVCLAHIETAARLDSSSVEAWRARALLLFELKLWEMKLQPRREDWRAILAECAAHDPDNALYDYLAALQLWTSSTAYDVADDGWILTVQNEAISAEASSRFVTGLAKPYLQFGTDGPRATLRFLERTTLAPSEQLAAAGSRQTDNRATTLLYSLMRWQGVVSNVAARNGDSAAAAAAAARNVQALAGQVTEQGNSAELSGVRLILRRWSLANLNKLSEDHPMLLDADETGRVAAELAAVRLDFSVHQAACQRLAAAAGFQTTQGNAIGTRARWSSELLGVLVAGAAQLLVVVTVAFAAAAWLVARIVHVPACNAADGMGWIRHVLVWSAGLGISFGLLGVVPASVRPAVWTEARALHLDADELRSALNLQDARWTWAFLQWLVHDGPIVAASLSIGLLVVWQVLRRARRAGGIQQYVRSAKREHLRLAGDTVARSCLVAALIALLGYFAVTPTVVASPNVGRREQLRRDRLTNPASVWTELSQTIAQIRSDESLMRRLAEELADEDRRLSEQESQ